MLHMNHLATFFATRGLGGRFAAVGSTHRLACVVTTDAAAPTVTCSERIEGHGEPAIRGLGRVT